MEQSIEKIDLNTLRITETRKQDITRDSINKRISLLQSEIDELKGYLAALD